MGPVTPLLAVLRKMKAKKRSAEFAWVGTDSGPEKTVIQQEGIPFSSIHVAKLPRFISLRLGTFPIDSIRAMREAQKILHKEKPDLVVSAGAFSSVPLVRKAARQGIKTATHQLDVKPGLSNKLMARVCDMVTTSFKYDNPPFAKPSTQIATPCRFAGVKMPSQHDALKRLGLDPKKKTVFIFGGGTGAAALNDIVEAMLDELPEDVQLLHLFGRGKGSAKKRKNYRSGAFFDEIEMKDAYAAADLVVSRAGLGTISELACLKVPAILMPIPNSHQETNADAMPYPVVRQTESGVSDILVKEITSLLDDEKKKNKITEDAAKRLPTDDGSALADAWLGLLK